ncbi:S8 family peptidase [Rhizobium azibense]|uniref:Subtilase family protein n=1 Tax=Rhizobium azibense TaxID=1136135 RepID=A0A4R3RDC7_9HYPH|nr:S8 family peptidase [Rhizobium azibense]TCU32891.1 subtilase family protein [Rhizobium azibense]
MTIAVESRVSVPLFVSPAARATTQGLKLLNFQSNAAKPQQNEPSLDLASFFISRSGVKSLNSAIEKYTDWPDDTEPEEFEDLLGDDGDDSKRPRNFKLFESAALIRPATLRDFWTDGLDRFPRKRGEAIWEVWTRAGYEDAFEKAAETFEVSLTGRVTQFIETAVRNVTATPEDMQNLVRVSGAVVELRGASSFVSDYMNVSLAARRTLAADLAENIVTAPSGTPRVTVLDTGVNHRNPLLSGSLRRSRCYTVSDDWAISDHDGHGTKMAGVALFGDLSNLQPRATTQLLTSLESVVVAAPIGGIDVPARDAIQKAVELVESQDAARVFCLAQTAPGEPEDGRPSSTSAALDQLAYSDGKKGRLFCVAVGNVDHSEDEPYQVADYIERNRRHGVQSPAQALNALAVGAITRKVSGSSPLVASDGDLSPTSRTSQEWEARAVKKPDIVMEGGNFEVDPGGVFSRASAQNLVLTTSREAETSPLAMTGETSAATAAASGLAAKLMARYPKFRVETVRGLVVHSAEWTPAMLQQQRELEQATTPNDAWAALLARYGWGIPNEQRLFASTESSMTMVVEDDLQPYELGDDNRPKLKEMKYFKLPWPTRELAQLNQTQVEMRCTLSYFVEPDPHAIARNRYDRYPSHRLKFDIKRFNETDTKAQLRVNALGDDDDSTSVADDGWLIGRRVRVGGTVVQDTWTGPAYRLADRDGISVIPVRGWWGDIRQSERYRRKVRFSLIVSMRIPEGSVNIYQVVRAAVPARALVEGAVPVTT